METVLIIFTLMSLFFMSNSVEIPTKRTDVKNEAHYILFVSNAHLSDVLIDIFCRNCIVIQSGISSWEIVDQIIGKFFSNC